jgi:pseudouridine-5'-monophosphatase
MDGLLLATEQIYTDAMRVVVGRYGKKLDWSLKAQIIGLQAIESARHTVAALHLPITAEAYLQERDRELKPRLAAAQCKPGARELVEHLHRCGVRQAVATSSSRELFALKTTRHQDWFRLFDHVVSVDDPEIEQGKPAPDVFIAAARRLGAEVADCLVFEDSPAGVAAAVAAGMPVVAIPEPEMDRDRFVSASQILESLLAFEPEKWGLPGRPAPRPSQSLEARSGE